MYLGDLFTKGKDKVELYTKDRYARASCVIEKLTKDLYEVGMLARERLAREVVATEILTRERYVKELVARDMYTVLYTMEMTGEDILAKETRGTRTIRTRYKTNKEHKNKLQDKKRS